MEELKHSDPPFSQFKPLKSQIKYSSNDLLTKCETAQDLLCSICFEFPLSPIECTQCRCHFCEACVTQWKLKRAHCPNQCEKAQYGKAHPFFYKSLFALKVKCKNKECGEEFLLEQAQNHIQTCKYQEVQCTLCETKMLRSDIVSHIENCKLGDCPTCGMTEIPLKSHNCVTDLLRQLESTRGENKKYKEMVASLNEQVQKLTEEVKYLKQAHRGSKPPQSLIDATILCKQKHKMTMMKKTPYFLRHADCDQCNARKISKFFSCFFHCLQCNYDLCPNCAKEKL